MLVLVGHYSDIKARGKQPAGQGDNESNGVHGRSHNYDASSVIGDSKARRIAEISCL